MMKITRHLFLASLLILPAAFVSAGEQNDEEAAVRAVVLDYFEGWFGGDAERFASALHPELAKRIPVNRDGKTVLHPSDIGRMVEYIKSGRSKKSLEDMNIQVTVFEIHKDTATAKGSCNDFYDYVHLAKIDGKWKIVNVLWQMYDK